MNSRRIPADPMGALLGRSLDALDEILDNCRASIESRASIGQDGECDRMINSSLRYLDDVTDGVKDGDPKLIDDVVVRRDLASLDNLITTSTNRLTDGREDAVDDVENSQPST